MCVCFAASCDWSPSICSFQRQFNVFSPIQPTFPKCLDLILYTYSYLCVLIYITYIIYMFTVCCAWHLAVWICLCKMFMFMYPSPGVKRTFPHIPICGTEFPGVEQEAGAVLLVAFPSRPSPNRAPLVRAQHLVNGGAVLVSQGG